MKQSNVSYRRRYALVIASIAATLLLAISCSRQPGQPASGVQPNAPMLVTLTSVPFGSATATSAEITPTDPLAWVYYSGTGTPPAMLTQQAHESAYATSDARILTQAAPTAAIYGLTYTAIALGPTRTPLPSYPTATPALGLFNCFVHGYLTSTCWAGTVNGQVIVALAGRGLGEQYASVAIYHGLGVEYFPTLASDEEYRLPCDVYSVGVVSVDGTRITLVPQNVYGPSPTPAPTPVMLVFDLATRQWVSSTCGPLPPTFTPGSPLTSLPSAAEPLPMGVFTCDPRPGAPYLERSCWRGQIDNKAITVAAGCETLNLPNGDENQGVIEIYPGSNFGFYGQQGQVYDTPLRVGPILISSVDGSNLTLVAADHRDPLNWSPLPGGTTFIFDLATRQFLNTAGSPMPTTPALTP